MIIQSNKAPEEFLKRYKRIKSGEEKIETVEQLKDFWLFAIGFGEKDITVREVIARLVDEVEVPAITYICLNNLMSEEARRVLSAASIDWETAVVDSTRDNDDEKEGIQYSNWHWKSLKEHVEAINPRRYPKFAGNILED